VDQATGIRVVANDGVTVVDYDWCIGCRYCEAACPYHARRFNWHKPEIPADEVNPDQSYLSNRIRPQGVMEKCTFCVQRITEAKDRAKDAGERVADGQLRTACQQTCPTDAIVFGDLNDPRSRASRFKNDPRAFRVIEGLNTKPVISYMSKVRNKAGGQGHGHGGEHHG
jgi:molybdopterin-containing oxidoreductase family iron-sulfur binding subunit